MKLKEKVLSGNPIKSIRKKGKEPRKKQIIRLQPEDIQVPEGIFQTQDEQPVAQLPVQQIGPGSQGIVVVRYSEAKPYMQMSLPISTKGLALLVLDHDHDDLKHQGEIRN